MKTQNEHKIAGNTNVLCTEHLASGTLCYTQMNLFSGFPKNRDTNREHKFLTNQNEAGALIPTEVPYEYQDAFMRYFVSPEGALPFQLERVRKGMY